eukprot:COSAG01_NODE_3319_length_6269_cov_5.161264_8_plen_126_part_00
MDRLQVKFVLRPSIAALTEELAVLRPKCAGQVRQITGRPTPPLPRGQSPPPHPHAVPELAVVARMYDACTHVSVHLIGGIACTPPHARTQAERLTALEVRRPLRPVGRPFWLRFTCIPSVLVKED